MAYEGSIIMPFGKYKGEELSNVPTSYLDWLIGQDWFQGSFRSDIEAHLETRADWKRRRHEDDED